MHSRTKLLVSFFVLSCVFHSSSGWIRKQRTKKTRRARDGDVKLIDGTNPNEGTVLIFKGYDWGTICDDGWDINEAKIVCRQLGMGEPRDVLHRNYFRTRGYSHMLLDDLECHGNETSLSNCSHYYPWGQHDCHNIDEIAGVRCYITPTKIEKYPRWNPLGVEHPSKRKIISMQKRNFSISSQPHINDSYGVYAVAHVGNETGGICPDDLTLVEATVFCRQIGRGYAKYLYQVNFNASVSASKHTLRPGLCYGNETDLRQCKTYASPGGVPCYSKKTVTVVCVNALPDLQPDLPTLQSSAYLAQLPLWLLSCSMEEKCLSASAYSAVESQSQYAWQYMKRNLLRFTSIIANEGTGEFVPLDPIDEWEWHACHLHYHSMKLFAKYEVVNRKKYLLAAGHKASFCLEDNECKDPNARKFRCSTTEFNRGTQGISPGCKDIYLHNYDCQWVDITDLPLGVFEFRIIVNPEFKVSELNYFNNAIVCTMYNMATTSFLRNCRFAHPHDL